MADSEPSMEDILSSIKRIIAEDSDAALSAPRGKRAVAAAGAYDLPVQQANKGAQGDEDDDGEVLELTEHAAVEAVAPAEVEEPLRARVNPPEPAAEKPPLVSPAVLEASRSSLAALSALIVKPEVNGSDTLEGLVREMLKPMLASWLDEKLPDVVERLVAQEIQRITARG